MDGRLGFPELLAQRGVRPALDQAFGDAVGAAAGLGQIPLGQRPAAGVAGALGVQFLVIGAHGFADQLGIEEQALQAREHACVELLGRVGAPLAAAACGAHRSAAVLAFADDGETTAAHAAAHQAGQEPLRAPALFGARQLRGRTAPGLRRQPELFFDNAQVGFCGDLPVGFRIEHGRAAAGFGVLHKAAAVEDEAAAIEFVAQDPVPGARIAEQGVRPPRPAARGGDVLSVQALDDGERRQALARIFGEDPHHDGGLSFVDRA